MYIRGFFGSPAPFVDDDAVFDVDEDDFGGFVRTAAAEDEEDGSAAVGMFGVDKFPDFVGFSFCFGVGLPQRGSDPAFGGAAGFDLVERCLGNPRAGVGGVRVHGNQTAGQQAKHCRQCFTDDQVRADFHSGILGSKAILLASKTRWQLNN